MRHGRSRGERMEKITQIDKGSMKRILRVGDLFAVGYGDLGSSIYYALGITALFSLGAAPISLAIAGLVFACTALSYAELSALLKDTGGSATFTRHAFNDLISFIAGWGLLLDFIVTIAISSCSIAPYLSFFFETLKIPSIKIGFTVAVILVLFCMNYFGVKHSTRVSWVLTSITLITQIMIVIVGAIWFIQFPDLWEHLRIGIKGSSWSPSWPNFWKGTAMAMVAYTGIESMAQLSGEAKNPGKTVPQAMMLAMGMLLFVYIGLAIVALSAVTPELLSHKYLEDPVAGIVSQIPFGQKFLGGWIGLLAAIILFVASNAGLIGASRLSFNMGEHYQLPRFVYKLHPKFKTPYASLATFALLAIIVVLATRGKITFLANLYNFGAMLAFFMTHLSLIFLRIKKPKAERPFRVPFNLKIRGYAIPVTAIVGGIATAATWFLVIITKADGRNLGFLWIIMGLVIYYLFRRKESISPTGSVAIQKIKVPGFEAKKYSQILVPTRGGKETQSVQMACEIAKVHGAKVTAVHVIEVPFSLPLETTLLNHRAAKAHSILERAEAIGREFNIGMKLRVIHARSVEKAILDLIEKEEFDLLVMGTINSPNGVSRGYGALAERVIKGSTCPVWICCHA